MKIPSEVTRAVMLESPYAGEFKDLNLTYATRCMRDSLSRGEAPFGSHLLYTHPGLLDDDKPEERKLGIDAGLLWAKRCDAVVVYVDLGITPGMIKGIAQAKRLNIPIECRSINPTNPGAVEKANEQIVAIK